MIDQKFEFAEVRIRRAISLASDIVTLRRLLHWTAWSFRYHVDPSIVEFAQETMELRRFYRLQTFDLIRSKLVQSVHKGLSTVVAKEIQPTCRKQRQASCGPCCTRTGFSNVHDVIERETQRYFRLAGQTSLAKTVADVPEQTISAEEELMLFKGRFGFKQHALSKRCQVRNQNNTLYTASECVAKQSG